MKDFFKSFFASFLAVTMFVGLVFVLVMVLVAAMGASGKPSVPSKAVLVMDLSMAITDSTKDVDPSAAFQKAMGGGEASTLPLLTIIDALDRAAQDKNISALYLTGNTVSMHYGSGPAALKELREALLRFRERSGKPMVAYNMYWGKNDLLLAAGATSLHMNPAGLVDVTGFVSEITFYAGAFKKYGIEIQPARVGKYKSYIEPFILDKMSPENREQINGYLGEVWSEWKESIAKDRKKTSDEIQALADTKGALSATEALQAGLVNKLSFEDQVLDELKGYAGKTAKDREFPQITIEDYAKIPHSAKGKNRIAVVYAEGTINNGEAPGEVGGDRVARELRKLRLDPAVKAVVLRVNSPGGSASASDQILRELTLIRKDKPVVVSMGTVAASGGYYISALANRIFAEPNTITGSIGVMGMVPNMKKLANEHGITWDSVQMAKLASPSLTRPATSEELSRVQQLTDNIYDMFLSYVAEGRKMKREAVHEIAQGRVWSGKDALKLGLVDELGGLQDAIRHAATLAKVQTDYRVDMPPQARTPMERIVEALSGERHKQANTHIGPMNQVQRELEQVTHALSLLGNNPQGVYMLMPYQVNIR